MIQINVKELLKKQKKTKYWFVKQMEGGYQSLTRMMENQTSSIRFDRRAVSTALLSLADIEVAS